MTKPNYTKMIGSAVLATTVASTVVPSAQATTIAPLNTSKTAMSALTNLSMLTPDSPLDGDPATLLATADTPTLVSSDTTDPATANWGDTSLVGVSSSNVISTANPLIANGDSVSQLYIRVKSTSSTDVFVASVNDGPSVIFSGMDDGFTYYKVPAADVKTNGTVNQVVVQSYSQDSAVTPVSKNFNFVAPQDAVNVADSSVTSSATATTKRGVSYVDFPGTTLTYNFDSDSGAKKVELIKDGSAVNSTDFNGEKTATGTFDIREAGTYSFRYTDVFGRIKDVPLADVSTLNNDISINRSPITFHDPAYKTPDFKADSSGTQYVTNQDATYEIQVDHLSDPSVGARFVVDGVTIPVTHITADKTTNDTWSIAMSDLRDKISDQNRTSYSGTLEILDSNGNVIGSTNLDFKYSPDAPTVDSVTPASGSNTNTTSGTTYVAPGTVLKIKTSSEVGISKTLVQRVDAAGEVLSETPVTNGTYTVTETGTYKVVTTDNLGRVTTSTDFGSLSNKIEVVADPSAVQSANIDNTVLPTDKSNAIWFHSDGPVLTVNSTMRFTSRVIVEINGVEVANEPGFWSTNKTVTIPYKDFPAASGGSYEVKVTATNVLGKSVSSTYYAKVDNADPKVKSITSTGTARVIDGVTYVKPGFTYNWAVNTAVNPAGIKSVEILKDGQPIVTTTDTTGSVDISKYGNGKYTIRITANNGRVTTQDLATADTTATIGYVQEAPKTTWSAIPTPNLVDNGNNWYVNAPTLEYTSTGTYANAPVITVNGVIVDSPGGKIDLSKYQPVNNGYVVEVTTSNILGEKSTVTQTLYVDSTAPSTVKGETTANLVAKPWGTFSTTDINLTMASSDSGVGIARYEIMENGKVSEVSNLINLTGRAGIQVRSVDKLGNASPWVSAEKLLGVQSGNFYKSTTAPSISIDRPAGLENWFKDDQQISTTITDAVSLDNATVTINGVKVSDYQATALEKGTKLTFSTKGIPANKDYSYDIKVTAKNAVGLTTTKSDTIYVDGTAPSAVKGTTTATINSKTWGNFSLTDITMAMNSTDSGVGLSHYEMEYNGAVTRVDSVLNLTGKSGVRVRSVDRLGNASAWQTPEALLGLKSTSFIKITEKPTIKLDRPEGYKSWFKDDQTMTATVNDAVALDTVDITVNGQRVTGFTADRLQTQTVLNFSTKGIRPNADGSYTVLITAKNPAGLTVTKSDTIYIDRVAPTVDNFTFTVPGYKPGKSANGSDVYGFFFQGATGVDIKVSDAAPSSGIKNIEYTLRNSSGAVVKTATAPVSGGIARVELPVDFKGFISARATDNVDNTGATNRPDGVITESSNMHVNSSDIKIDLAGTPNKDSAGLPLYNADSSASVKVTDTFSGVKSYTWGIGDQTLGSSTGLGVTGTDRNLNTILTGNLPLWGNSNNMKIWVKTIDNAGHESRFEKSFSIDKDAPVIDVAYDSSIGSGYYQNTRTATVRITERNFDQSKVKFTGKYGTVSNWTKNGDTWTATVSFAAEDVYKWGLSYTDNAGNAGKTYQSEEFTIDKTNPKIDMVWDNNNAKNGKYYASGRTATIRLTERNFDPSKFVLKGTGTISGWTNSGDVHTTTVTFPKDGEYQFSLSATDKSGRASNVVESGSFVISSTKPSLTIEGVDNGGAYMGNFGIYVKGSSRYFDKNASSVTLTRRNAEGKPVKMDVAFDATTGIWKAVNVPKSKDFDDVYTLESKIVDLAGNTVKDKRSFIVDRNGSLFKLEDKNSIVGQYLNKARDIIVQEATVSKIDLKDVRVALVVNGVTRELNSNQWSMTETGGVSSDYVYKYNINASNLTEDGNYKVLVFSKAAQTGKKNDTARLGYNFVLATKKPDIIVTGVEEAGRYQDTTRQATIQVRDVAPVDEIVVNLNGETVPATLQDTGNYTVDIKQGDSLQNMKVTVRDKAGNINQVEVANFLITASPVRYALSQTWVQWLLGGLLAIVLALGGRGILAAWKRRKKDKESEEDLYDLDDEEYSSGNVENLDGSSGSKE